MMENFELLPTEQVWEQIGLWLGIGLGIIQVISWLFSLFASILNYSKIRNVKSGIYNSFWIDPLKREVNCEILALSKSIRGIKLRPIYKHKAQHNYSAKLTPYSYNKDTFGGRWYGPRNTIYKGYCIFHYIQDNQTFQGKWIGPKNNGDTNNGDWNMAYYDRDQSYYLKYRKYKKIRVYLEKVFSTTSILSDIIVKHEHNANNPCIVENVELELENNSFNPLLGKISRQLAAYARSVTRRSDNVLDLGTGTGFYAVYLAKNIGCKVKGTDLDDRTITLARHNAERNNVSNFVEFDTCKKNELFSNIKPGEKFDVIVANLPFTRIAKSYRSRKSPLYSSFAGSVDLLEQLILGSHVGSPFFRSV